MSIFADIRRTFKQAQAAARNRALIRSQMDRAHAERTLAEDDAAFHQLNKRATAQLLARLEDTDAGYRSCIGEDFRDEPED
jgi:hypothetical protein